MKKFLSVFAIAGCALLLTGCGKDKKETKQNIDSNSNSDSNTVETSNVINSNVTSNAQSNVTSNVETSNVTSNGNNSNVTSNSQNSSNKSNTGVKNLSCSADYTKQMGLNSYGIKTIADVIVNFKDDKILNLSMKFTFTLPESLKRNIDTFISDMKSTYEKQYYGNHFKVSTKKITDSKFSVGVSMDYINMTADEKKRANMSGGSESYSVNKAEFEKQGFTCK